MKPKCTVETKKHQAEAESSTLTKMWDSLCLRSMGADGVDEKDALTRGTAADQFAVTRGAWRADSAPSRYVACNNCLGKSSVTKC